MTFKTIVVLCDADKSIRLRLDIAADLASKFASHLVGLHVRPPFQPPVYFDGSFAMDDLYKVYEDTQAANQETALSAFSAATEGRNLVAAREIVDGQVEREVVKRARCADLTVLGQANDETPAATPRDLVEVVALSAGRPVLVVPYVPVPRPIGRNVILCWNDSRESARAVSDALPLLKQADKVAVLAFRSADDETGAPSVATWLAHHGIDATVIEDSAGDLDVGDLVLSRAADIDADLIVMGVYGHTRMREMMLGGVSRTLLRSMTVPVLMAH